MTSFSKFPIKIPNSIFIGIFSTFGQEDHIQNVDVNPVLSLGNDIKGPAVENDGNTFTENLEEEVLVEIVYEKCKTPFFKRISEGIFDNYIRFKQGRNRFLIDSVRYSIFRMKKGKKQDEIWVRESEMGQPNNLAIAPYGNDLNVNESVKGILGINDTVVIASKIGKIIKEVQLMGVKPLNITFAGENGKSSFFTMVKRGCFATLLALNSGTLLIENTNLIYIT